MVFRATNRLHYMNPGIGVVQRQPAGADDWFLAGGAPVPIAAWTLKGAVSQAAGEVNLITPGTFDLSGGVAPTWSVELGSIHNGTTQYRMTGITPGADYAMIVRFAGASAGTFRTPIGSAGSVIGSLFRVIPTSTTGLRYYQHGSSTSLTGEVTAGVMGLTPTTGYLNGAVDATYVSSWSGVVYQIAFGALNNIGTIIQYWLGSVQAAAIWDTSTDHATWMPAVSAAVALL